MKHHRGDLVTAISLPSIDGGIFDLDALRGRRYLLSFFRFASCPFCNLRVHELVSSFDGFGVNFTIVAIFDSPLDNLQEHAEGHCSPFPILADPENIYYQKYGIEHSVAGMFKSMFFRMPALLQGIFKGYLPLEIKGSITTMPADFLVDEDGVIQRAYYGRDEGDHLPIKQVKDFSLASG